MDWIRADGRLLLVQFAEQASALRFPAKEDVGGLGLLGQEDRFPGQGQGVGKLPLHLVKLSLVTEGIGKGARIVDARGDVRGLHVGVKGL